MAYLTRRQALRIGGLGIAGLSLANALQADATRNPAASKIKSCILLFYYGGPCQLDTWDMKPDAPVEVRGQFRSVATKAPGIRICEHLPKTARVMDKLAIVRSMHHPMRNHNSAAVETFCGRTPLKGDLELLADDPNSFPNYGSILSALTKQRGEVPIHVALPHVLYNVVVLPGQTAGFLGAAHNHFQVTRDPSQANFGIDELALPAEVPLARLDDRKSLLSLVDSQLRQADRTVRTRGMTTLQTRAFNLLRSEKVRQAFDLAGESVALRDHYGRHKLGQSLLLARRLVESGVRFVNVNDKIRNGQLENWDSHDNNFGRLKDDLLPPADQGFSALIEDLDARGLLDSTLVIAMGEFGRTPQINKSAGRDHWPDVYSIVLAGGGIRGGSVYGSSDKIGAYPAADPVTPGDLAATLFWRLGIDPTIEIRDLTGRPYHVAEGEPIRKLFA
jgi:hypothetical protein